MTKEEIHIFCKKYRIKNYTINADGSIDVNGNVILVGNQLKELPLRFEKVTGYFDCSWGNLTSLKGSPNIVCGLFDCDYNPLESLEGIPLNISENLLYLPDGNTYDDYLSYCRDIKFKKILK